MNSIFVALIFLLTASGAPQQASSNSHVAIDVKSPSAVKAGTTGELNVFFRPKKGIHINADPAIDVVPEKNPVIASVGAITPSKNSKGYVDAAKPVKVSAVISPSAPKGARTVKVKVVYFLCSDAEGWCNREEQTLDLQVTVK
jgi:hypothetical protein